MRCHGKHNASNPMSDKQSPSQPLLSRQTLPFLQALLVAPFFK